MELSYPKSNLGDYISLVVASKIAGGPKELINGIANRNYLLGFNTGYECAKSVVYDTGFKNGYKAGSLKTGLIIGIIGGAAIIGSVITTALITKKKYEKKAKLEAAN